MRMCQGVQLVVGRMQQLVHFCPSLLFLSLGVTMHHLPFTQVLILAIKLVFSAVECLLPHLCCSQMLNFNCWQTQRNCIYQLSADEFPSFCEGHIFSFYLFFLIVWNKMNINTYMLKKYKKAHVKRRAWSFLVIFIPTQIQMCFHI